MEAPVVVFGMLLFVGIAIMAFVATKAQKKDKLAGLACAAHLLEDSSHVEGSPEVHGNYHGGRELVFRYTVRGSGSNAQNWTEIEALLGDVPLSLELRPHSRVEDNAIERGHAVDLQTGHAGFDARYVVEGAPKEVIEAALDRPMCERLLWLGKRARVQTVGSTHLRFENRGWVHDPIQIQRRLELAADLGDALCEAHAEIDQATIGVGESYRGSPSGAATERARDARHDQLAELERIKEERSAHDAKNRRLGFFVVSGVGVATWLFYLYVTGH